jgi:glyoxylase-like metal-dependent hydrolase (beta-lactamase superfamily II)
MTEITPIELGMVNAYLIKTDNGFVLVDTGMPNLLSKLKQGLADAGCTPENLNLIILTHGDLDHVGNAMTIKREYGAKIAMHEADFKMIKEGKPYKREVSGFVWKILSLMSGIMAKPISNFEADQFLTDSQRLDEAGLPARILHIPGHTPGSIAILTDDGQLISGDIFGNQRVPDLTPLVENRAQMLASVEKIKQANPKIIFPGHGKPFSGEELENI